MQKSSTLLFDREFLMKKIASNLSYLLRETGITAKHLGEKTGISSSLLSKYKKSEALAPIDNLLAICKYFKVSVDSFLLEDYEKGYDVLSEPTASYERSQQARNRELQARVNELELALHRHIKDPDILRKYLDDA